MLQCAYFGSRRLQQLSATRFCKMKEWITFRIVTMLFLSFYLPIYATVTLGSLELVINNNNKTGRGCCHLSSTGAQLIEGTHLGAHILRSKFACRHMAQAWSATRVRSCSSSNTANAHSKHFIILSRDFPNHHSFPYGNSYFHIKHLYTKRAAAMLRRSRH